MKLNGKLGLLIIASSILGLVVFIVLSLIIGDIVSKGYAPRELNALGVQMVEEAEQASSDQVRIIDLLERTASEHPQLDLAWVTHDGTLVYATNGRTSPFAFHEIASAFLHTPNRYWMPEQDITFVFAWEQGPEPQYFIMQTPVDAMQGSQVQLSVRENSDIIALILPFLLFLFTPYFVSFLFVLRINHRLKNLTRAMNHVNAEKTTIEITDYSQDEIGQLTRHFNAMSKRISEQVTQIQEFERNRKTLIANLSHDLRTPMTKIQGYAETLLEELVDASPERKNYVEIITNQSHYMERLLQKLLEIANLDSIKGNLELTESNVAEHVRKIAADFVPIVEMKGIQFAIQIPDEPVYAMTNAYLFERAIRNLLENAIQYGRSGRYLGLAVEETGKEVHIRIADRGPGILEAQIPLLFERFYRGSAARQGEGIGIGLSIVREIAELHHGEVDVHSVANENTVFTLTLPAGTELREKHASSF